MTKLKAITQPLSLSRIAYDMLRDFIIHGNLKPGNTYNEMVIAKDLGISRTPVREALLELSAQGLVTFLPRKGIMIKNFTRKDVEDIFELRRLIELFAIEKVTKSEPPCDLSRLINCLDVQKKAFKKSDFVLFMKVDREFHATFCELANNPRIVAILENIRDLVHVIGLQGLSKEGRGEVVIREHDEILRAVVQKDIVKAKSAMEAHLSMSEQTVLQFF